MTDSANRCGSCKWLDVPATELTKRGDTHKRRDYTMYYCRVPFVMPAFPASVRVETYDKPERRMMCPSYGEKCTFHERRQA